MKIKTKFEMKSDMENEKGKMKDEKSQLTSIIINKYNYAASSSGSGAASSMSSGGSGPIIGWTTEYIYTRVFLSKLPWLGRPHEKQKFTKRK